MPRLLLGAPFLASDRLDDDEEKEVDGQTAEPTISGCAASVSER
jgi:hypothetical protein